MKTNFIFLLIFFCLFLSACGNITVEKFDSYKWKNLNLNIEENQDLRWNMMNDLRKKHKLVGMTKSEIENLLGKFDDENKTYCSYYLGLTGRGINTGTLTLTFDKNNVVTSISVTQG